MHTADYTDIEIHLCSCNSENASLRSAHSAIRKYQNIFRFMQRALHTMATIQTHGFDYLIVNIGFDLFRTTPHQQTVGNVRAVCER